MTDIIFKYFKGLEGSWSSLVTQVREANQIPVSSNCFGWIAVNKGDGVAVVDNVELLPAAAPGLSGESTGLVHPLAFPYKKPVLTVTFNGGTIFQVQIIQLINY